MRDDTERLRNALFCLDPGVARDEWVRILMALKAAGGDVDLADEWSSMASNYVGRRDVEMVWKSISPDGGIKAGTLFHLARAAGHREQRTMSNVQAIRSLKTASVAQPSALEAAHAVWASGQPATADHWYVANKRLLLDGVRVYRGNMVIKGIALDGALMVPGFRDGRLVTLQFVTPQAKLHFPGLKVEGFYSVGGKIAGDVYLCEGIGAAHTCHQATGRPAVASFGAGNTLRAAEWILAQGGKPIIVADKGKEHQAAEIARDLDCAWVEMPTDAPSNYDINDMHCASNLDAVARFLDSGIRRHTRKYSLLSAADLLALPAIRWRIKHVLPETGIGIIGGQSTAGKTFIALDMALRIASGMEFFGHRSYKCPVVYLALEGAGGFAGRLRAWRIMYGDMPSNLHFVLRQTFDVRDAHDRAELMRSLTDIGFAGGVVIIDTLAQAAIGMEENSSEGMGQAIAGLQELQEAVGGLVMASHHLGKDASRGLRGHSSLFAACDVVMEVARDGDARYWKIAKNKDGKDSETFGFELVDIEIGKDYDGEAVTSCVVRQIDADQKKAIKPAVPSGGHQRIAYDVLRRLLDTSSTLGRDGAPPTRPCIRLETAIEAVKEKLVCDKHYRTSRAREAINGLIARGLFDANENWLWSIEK